MRHIQARRHYLEQLITGEVKPEQGALKACTLVGKPKEEFMERYQKWSDNCLNWMKEQGIEFKWEPQKATSVNFYVPGVDGLLAKECYVTVKNPSVNQINQIVEATFDELWDVYEVEIPPQTINMIAGLVHPEDLTFSFENLLSLLKGYNQAEIGKIVNRSRQTICDMKKGRKNLTLEVAQSLMKEFPLLPWQSLIMLLDLS